MKIEAKHIPIYSRNQLSCGFLDGVAHQPFGRGAPWHCCGRPTRHLSTSGPQWPPNNPSCPHTISVAPKLVNKKKLSDLARNQIKQTIEDLRRVTVMYWALVRNFLRQSFLLRLRPSLQETGVLPSARDFAVSFLSGLTAKGARPSAAGESDGKDGADGVHFLCRQPILSRR